MLSSIFAIAIEIDIDIAMAGWRRGIRSETSLGAGRALLARLQLNWIAIARSASPGPD
jgi:hypothetical protein